MVAEQKDGKLVELAKQCVADSDKWFPESNNIPHHTLGLAGEVGEFANWVKKIDRGSADIHTAKVRYELAMELTDVFIYLLNLAGMLHVDLEKTYMMKRAENEKRFGKNGN